MKFIIILYNFDFSVETVDHSIPANSTFEGKFALLPKASSWVYEPLEMDLENGSGDGDAETDSGIFFFTSIFEIGCDFIYIPFYFCPSLANPDFGLPFLNIESNFQIKVLFISLILD